MPIKLFRLYLFHLLQKLKAAIEQRHTSSFDGLKNLSFFNAGRIDNSYNFGKIEGKLIGPLILPLETEILFIPNFEVQIIDVQLKQKLLNIWLEALPILVAQWGQVAVQFIRIEHSQKLYLIVQVDLVGEDGKLFLLVVQKSYHGGVSYEMFDYADGSFMQFYGYLFDVVVVALGGHQVWGYLATRAEEMLGVVLCFCEILFFGFAEEFYEEVYQFVLEVELVIWVYFAFEAVDHPLQRWGGYYFIDVVLFFQHFWEDFYLEHVVVDLAVLHFAIDSWIFLQYFLQFVKNVHFVQTHVQFLNQTVYFWSDKLILKHGDEGSF